MLSKTSISYKSIVWKQNCEILNNYCFNTAFSANTIVNSDNFTSSLKLTNPNTLINKDPSNNFSCMKIKPNPHISVALQLFEDSGGTQNVRESKVPWTKKQVLAPKQYAAVL